MAASLHTAVAFIDAKSAALYVIKKIAYDPELNNLFHNTASLYHNASQGIAEYLETSWNYLLAQN